MTSSTASGGSPVRASSARTTVAPSSWAATSRSAPPNRPTGVRSGSQMTASRMGTSEVVAGDGLGDTRRSLGALDIEGDLGVGLDAAVEIGEIGQLDPGT